MTALEQRLKDSGRKILLGMGVYTYNPVFVEMLGMLGFDVAWIETEHTQTPIGQVADLCRMATGCGMLTLIRIPDTTRGTVLHAVECGPDIIDLPMGNSPEIAAELVANAKYAPVGGRGFFGGSRAVRYSVMAPVAEEQKRINEQLCAMVQIETREAVERADEICAVPGMDGIFIGPGDLSASYGKPGVFDDEVRGAMDRAIAAAKRAGKLVAMAGSFEETAHWAERGVDLLLGGSDISCMKDGLRALHTRALAQLASG